jgi:hypothetical protein
MSPFSGIERLLAPSNRFPAVALGLALLCGVALRLVWLSEMEWKSDEIKMFERSQNLASGAAWEWTGMTASIGIPNPGMSLWFFSLLALWLHDPVEMTAAVAVLNLLGIAGCVWFALTRVAPADRSPWLLGVVILCVNPLAVMSSRKLWAQDVLMPCSVIVMFAFAARRTRWGAFAWGLSGTLLGQIHLSGFFFQAALVSWALCESKCRTRAPSTAPRGSVADTCWMEFVSGTALGALPMIPWMYQLGVARVHQPPRTWTKVNTLVWCFHYMVFNPLGLTTVEVYFRSDPWSFLRGPVVAGRATYLVLTAHIVLAGLVASSLIRISTFEHYMKLRDERPDDRWMPLGVVLFMGLLLVVVTPFVLYFYLTICSWLSAVILVQFLQAGFPRRGTLMVIIVATLQFVISASLLWTIHDGHGTPDEYGVPYRFGARSVTLGAK